MPNNFQPGPRQVSLITTPAYYKRRVQLTLLLVVAACYFLIGSPAQAIEVVEGEPDVVSPAESPYNADYPVASEQPDYPQSGNQNVAVREYKVIGATASPNSSGELFIRVQELEAEVRELRGMVEEQAYLIQQLGQRRLDDYIDLDRRISELQGVPAGGASTSGVAPAATQPASKPALSTATTKPKPQQQQKPAGAAQAPVTRQPPSAAVADTAREAYRSAYQKVKDRQFSEAKVALTVFVSDFPDSQYVPNAYFWLGELYYLDSNLKKARDAFYVLVTEHSNHRKVADAKFKLGKIYHQLGNVEQSKIMLQSVISDHPDSKAATPARDYLKNSLQ